MVAAPGQFEGNASPIPELAPVTQATPSRGDARRSCQWPKTGAGRCGQPARSVAAAHPSRQSRCSPRPVRRRGCGRVRHRRSRCRRDGMARRVGEAARQHQRDLAPFMGMRRQPSPGLDPEQPRRFAGDLRWNSLRPGMRAPRHVLQTAADTCRRGAGKRPTAEPTAVDRERSATGRQGCDRARRGRCTAAPARFLNFVRRDRSIAATRRHCRFDSARWEPTSACRGAFSVPAA